MSKKLVTCLVVGASVLLIGNNLSAEVGGPGPWPHGTGPEDFMSGTINNGDRIYYTTDQKKCPNCGLVPESVAKQLPGCPSGSCWTPKPVPLKPSHQ